MTPGRWLALVVLLCAGFFAWHGGSFTTSGYRQLEREEDLARSRITRLTSEVDSLRALRDSLESSPAVQERFAREQWGMIRNGELSFRIRLSQATPPDTSR